MKKIILFSFALFNGIAANAQLPLPSAHIASDTVLRALCITVGLCASLDWQLQKGKDFHLLCSSSLGPQCLKWY